MSQGVNFSSLQAATSAATTDAFLIRLNNALSGASGFAQINTTNVEKSFSVYTTIVRSGQQIVPLMQELELLQPTGKAHIQLCKATAALGVVARYHQAEQSIKF